MLLRCVALLLFLALVIEDIKEASEQRMRCGGEPDIGATPRLTHIPGALRWHNSEIHLGVSTSVIEAAGSP